MATVTISEAAKAHADELVRRGWFASVDEAVEAGLHRLRTPDGSEAGPDMDEDAEWLAGVKVRLAEAEAQVGRGEVLTAEEVFDPLLERYRQWPR